MLFIAESLPDMIFPYLFLSLKTRHRFSFTQIKSKFAKWFPKPQARQWAGIAKDFNLPSYLFRMHLSDSLSVQQNHRYTYKYYLMDHNNCGTVSVILQRTCSSASYNVVMHNCTWCSFNEKPNISDALGWPKGKQGVDELQLIQSPLKRTFKKHIGA